MRIASFVMIAVPSVLAGQAPPGTNLLLDVQIDSIVRHGDTTRIEYTLSSAASSSEPLFTFIVAAAAPATEIEVPSPASDWIVSTSYRSMPVALWGALTDAVAPGTSGQVLAFSAAGLPTVVDAWYRGYSPPPPLPDSIGIEDAFDPLTEASIAIRTVGVEPIPTDDPGALLQRLEALIDEACSETWIVQASVCESLSDLAAQAVAEVASGHGQEARDLVDALRVSIADARQQGIANGGAYWLLEINAVHVRDLIPVIGATTLTLAFDTYLRSGSPNQNQGTEPVLRIRSSGRNRALLRVDDAALAAVSAPIVSASLEFDIVFNGDNWGTSGRSVDVHRMLMAWTHFGATWNCSDDVNPDNSVPDCEVTAWEMNTLNPPPYDVSASGSFVVTNGLLGTISIDVTADVQAILAGEVDNHGWIMRKSEEGQAGRIDIASSEAGAGPRLVIEH